MARHELVIEVGDMVRQTSTGQIGRAVAEKVIRGEDGTYSVYFDVLTEDGARTWESEDRLQRVQEK